MGRIHPFKKVYSTAEPLQPSRTTHVAVDTPILINAQHTDTMHAHVRTLSEDLSELFWLDST